MINNLPAEVAYAVAYSLLLLNTDLHVAVEHRRKMTRSNFVRNTMETIYPLVFPELVEVAGDPNNNVIAILPPRGLLPVSESVRSALSSTSLKLRKSASCKSFVSDRETTIQREAAAGLDASQRAWLSDMEQLLKVRTTTTIASLS